MIGWFKKLFKKESLRDKCVNIYGEEFGEMHNSLNGGVPIGGFLETVTFIDMVEVAKKCTKEKINKYLHNYEN